jgi:phospholipid/cholesterol/gamma-HCH transport system substrate-binding protein
MQQSRASEIVTGAFVLFGFASLFFLVTQITNKDFTVSDKGGYELVANFENIGSLKVGAPVSMSGVTVGRVDSISYDQEQYKAVVRMHINSQFDRIPEDSDASIMTAGLLGGQYIGVTAGGSDQYFKTAASLQSCRTLVLENLINQLVANSPARRVIQPRSRNEQTWHVENVAGCRNAAARQYLRCQRVGSRHGY